MKLTVIPSDRTVYVDGVPKFNMPVENFNIPANVHALQWFDTRGWIEFIQPDPFTPQPAPQDITEIPSWGQQCHQAWVDTPFPEVVQPK